MNILLCLFRCFSLFVLASSFRIRESTYRGNLAPGLWKSSNVYTIEDVHDNRYVTDSDDEYHHGNSDYKDSRNAHQIPQPKRGIFQNTGEMKRNNERALPPAIADTYREIEHPNAKDNYPTRDKIFPVKLPNVPHLVTHVSGDEKSKRYVFSTGRSPSSITEVGSSVSNIKPYPYPGEKEVAQINLNNLLCVTDCRMVNFMMFNQPGNISSFQNKPLPGRPYSRAGLRTWCQDNCGKSPSWTNSDGKDELPDKAMENLKRKGEDINPEEGKSVASNPGIPYITFGVKPPGLIRPIAPVFPAIVLPQIRNFYPYPNIITTSLVFSRRNEKRMENTGQASAVSFRSLPDYSPETVSNRKHHPNCSHHQSKGPSYANIAEYNAFKESMKRKSDAEISEEDEETQQKDYTNGKPAAEPKNDRGTNSNEDENVESDYDDEDENEEGVHSIVVKFLREISKILLKKSFRPLLTRIASCDPERDALPVKDKNSTDFHGTGIRPLTA